MLHVMSCIRGCDQYFERREISCLAISQTRPEEDLANFFTGFEIKPQFKIKCQWGLLSESAKSLQFLKKTKHVNYHIYNKQKNIYCTYLLKIHQQKLELQDIKINFPYYIKTKFAIFWHEKICL